MANNAIGSISSIDSTKVNRISPSNISNQDNTVKSTQEGEGVSFADFLKDAINNVSQLQEDAKVAGDKLVTGEIQDIHSVMIAVEKAELALQFTLAVRNKVLDAYNEIMRMPI